MIRLLTKNKSKELNVLGLISVVPMGTSKPQKVYDSTSMKVKNGKPYEKQSIRKAYETVQYMKSTGYENHRKVQYMKSTGSHCY